MPMRFFKPYMALCQDMYLCRESVKKIDYLLTHWHLSYVLQQRLWNYFYDCDLVWRPVKNWEGKTLCSCSFFVAIFWVIWQDRDVDFLASKWVLVNKNFEGVHWSLKFLDWSQWSWNHLLKAYFCKLHFV